MKKFDLAILVALTIAITSCGRDTSEARAVAASVPNAQVSGLLGSGVAGANGTTINRFGGLITTVRGTQDILITITGTPAGNSAMTYSADFSSSGPAGAISFQSPLLPFFAFGPYGGSAIRFQTATSQNANVSAKQFAIDMLLVFQAGNQFDPTQSQISILDCEFFQIGNACGSTSTVTDAIIYNLGKR